MGPGEESKWDAIMVALQLTTPVFFLVVVAVRARMLMRKVWKMTSKLTSNYRVAVCDRVMLTEA